MTVTFLAWQIILLYYRARDKKREQNGTSNFSIQDLGMEIRKVSRDLYLKLLFAIARKFISVNKSR